VSRKSTVRREVGHRGRATAERNIDAICDAAVRLLERGAQASIAAVAIEAQLSRVTVYAHFPTRQLLLEAVLHRSVRAGAEALEAAQPESGEAFEALDRVIGVGWRVLDHAAAIARATAEELPSKHRHRLHGPVLAPIQRLVERGRREGSFRTDVSAEWLVACSYALIHAAADEVRAGRLDAASAPNVLAISLHDLFTPPSPNAASVRSKRKI
jgi:TetR/AcrR family transcriptional regulator, mexCD-oprJ operon repressor